VVYRLQDVVYRLQDVVYREISDSAYLHNYRTCLPDCTVSHISAT